MTGVHYSNQGKCSTMQKYVTQLNVFFSNQNDN